MIATWRRTYANSSGPPPAFQVREIPSSQSDSVPPVQNKTEGYRMPPRIEGHRPDRGEGKNGDSSGVTSAGGGHLA